MKHQHNAETPGKLSIADLVYGPGLMLLRLVVLRLYLGRDAQDDAEIFRVVVEAVAEVRRKQKAWSDEREQRKAIVPPFEDEGEDEKSDDEEPVFLPTHQIIRRFTIAEQALAARLGWIDTTGEYRLNAQVDADVQPLSPRRNMIKISSDFKLEEGEPSAYVWTTEDEPPYLWPRPKEPGLTGGPLYVRYDENGINAQMVAKPKPAPKPKRIAKRAASPMEGASEGLSQKRQKVDSQ